MANQHPAPAGAKAASLPAPSRPADPTADHMTAKQFEGARDALEDSFPDLCRKIDKATGEACDLYTAGNMAGGLDASRYAAMLQSILRCRWPDPANLWLGLER